MQHKKFPIPLGATLMVVIVTLVLVSGAWGAGAYKTLHKFTGGPDGRIPLAGLIFDGKGNLYGTAEYGGAYGYDWPGVVFELTPSPDGRWKRKTLYSFNYGIGGGRPIGSVILDAAGNLYGTAEQGSNYSCSGGCGTVFKLTPNPNGSWTESTLYSFTGGQDGWYPYAGLTFDAAGNLYSTTWAGGAHGYGVVFRLTPNPDGSWTESLIHSFTGQDGALPLAGLTLDAAGNLYGTAEFGGGKGSCYTGYPNCGVVFRLTPNPDGSWTESVLYSFSGGKDGGRPFAGLTFDQAGNLYGTAYQGGDGNYCGGIGCGVVFKLTPNPDGSWTQSVLHRFSGGKDGASPFASLILDAAGNLYSTTWAGGAHGYGVVFRLTPNPDGSSKESVLHAFRNSPGGHPYAGLVFDAAGSLYGTTEGDLSTTFGSVFEIMP